MQRKDILDSFEQQIGGRFACLLENEENDPEITYNKMKNIFHETAKQELGYQRYKKVPGLSTEIIDLCEKRRNAKLLMLDNNNNKECKENYKLLNKKVKMAVKRKKTQNLEHKIDELEEDFKRNNTHRLFTTIKQLEGKKHKQVVAIKDANGVLQMKRQNVLNIWKSHFESHLNKQFPRDENALLEIDQPSSSTESEFSLITEQEVENAIKQLKS